MNRHQKRQKQKKLREYLQNRPQGGKLTKKQREFYRPLILARIAQMGVTDGTMPYKTGVKRWRPQLQLSQRTGKPTIQHVPVEMVTYRNAYGIMLEKILALSVPEIEDFLQING